MADVADKDVKIVTMADGSIMEFPGKLGKKSTMNISEGTVTFNLSTGEQFTLAVTDIPYLTEYFNYPEAVRKLVIEGVRAKINSAINNSPEDKLRQNIDKIFNHFRSGNPARLIQTRGNKLDNEEKAYAILWNLRPSHPVWEGVVQSQRTWDNLNDPSVMAEVRLVWGGKTKKARHGIRKTMEFLNIYSSLEMNQPITVKAEVAEAEEE